MIKLRLHQVNFGIGFIRMNSFWKKLKKVSTGIVDVGKFENSSDEAEDKEQQILNELFPRNLNLNKPKVSNEKHGIDVVKIDPDVETFNPIKEIIVEAESKIKPKRDREIHNEKLWENDIKDVHEAGTRNNRKDDIKLVKNRYNANECEKQKQLLGDLPPLQPRPLLVTVAEYKVVTDDKVTGRNNEKDRNNANVKGPKSLRGSLAAQRRSIQLEERRLQMEQRALKHSKEKLAKKLEVHKAFKATRLEQMQSDPNIASCSYSQADNMLNSNQRFTMSDDSQSDESMATTESETILDQDSELDKSKDKQLPVTPLALFDEKLKETCSDGNRSFKKRSHNRKNKKQRLKEERERIKERVKNNMDRRRELKHKKSSDSDGFVSGESSRSSSATSEQSRPQRTTKKALQTRKVRLSKMLHKEELQLKQEIEQKKSKEREDVIANLMAEIDELNDQFDI